MAVTHQMLCAQEGRHEIGRGGISKAIEIAPLFDAAVSHENEFAREKIRFVEVVSHEHDSFVESSEDVAEFVLQFESDQWVERSEWFIH